MSTQTAPKYSSPAIELAANVYRRDKYEADLRNGNCENRTDFIKAALSISRSTVFYNIIDTAHAHDPSHSQAYQDKLIEQTGTYAALKLLIDNKDDLKDAPMTRTHLSHAVNQKKIPSNLKQLLPVYMDLANEIKAQSDVAPLSSDEIHDLRESGLKLIEKSALTL